MIDITFDEIGEHIERGDMKEWLAELKVQNATKGLFIDGRKTENCSEKPNNCDTCRHNKLEWYSEVCDGCSKAHSNYEPKDEPQTEEYEEPNYYDPALWE